MEAMERKYCSTAHVLAVTVVDLAPSLPLATCTPCHTGHHEPQDRFYYTFGLDCRWIRGRYAIRRFSRVRHVLSMVMVGLAFSSCSFSMLPLLSSTDVCSAAPLPAFAGHIEHGRGLQVVTQPAVSPPVYGSPRPYGYGYGYYGYYSPQPYVSTRARRLQTQVLPSILPAYGSPRPYAPYGYYSPQPYAYSPRPYVYTRARRLQTQVLPSILPTYYGSPRPYGYYGGYYSPRPYYSARK